MIQLYLVVQESWAFHQLTMGGQTDEQIHIVIIMQNHESCKIVVLTHGPCKTYIVIIVHT